MSVLSKTTAVLIVIAIVLMVFGIPQNGLSSEDKPPCQWVQTETFTFRIHPSSHGADTDIKIQYSATLNSAGTVSLNLLSVEADPWAYAKLESKIVTTESDAYGVHLEIHTKVVLNEVWPDVVDGEIVPLYGPTQDIGEIQRVIPGFSWGAPSCPEINNVQPETSIVTFEGHTIPERSYATRVKDVQGDVLIKNEGTGQMQRPVPGTVVKPGDTIETKNGEVTFYMVAAKIKMGAQTVVKFVKEASGFGEGPSMLQMVKGFLWAYAKKDKNSLKVATPNAICGVRGTKYKIRHDQATNTTIVEVEDGVVAFSDPQNRKTVEVKAGMKSVITGNDLPSDPVPIQ
jgi:hypothetical protein